MCEKKETKRIKRVTERTKEREREREREESVKTVIICMQKMKTLLL